MDFVGNMQKTQQITYLYPETTTLLEFVSTKVPELVQHLDERLRDRIVGIGIATPFDLWSWGDEVGAPKDIMNAWKDFDIRIEVGRAAQLPTFLLNDATAACAAELTFGNTNKFDNFLYIYISYFIGGGIVLNGSVFRGPSGNAGVLGPLPVRVKSKANSSESSSHQLIRDTSKISLQRMLDKEGIDSSVIWDKDGDWSVLGETLERWIEGAAEDLAYAIVSATSIIDFPAIVIDGDLPASIREKITQVVSDKLQTIDQQGLSPITVVEGSLGRGARLLGAASLPLLANFSRDRDLAFGSF
jgi:predicted NBD/HSP70 family sugar kinase